MDRLCIVTFDAGGRPVVERDLNDGTTYAMVRDAFKITAAPGSSLKSKSSIRFGGSRTVGQSHDNGSIESEWYVNGGSADASMARMDDLLASLHSLSPDRYIEWRPEGSTRSTFYEIRGPGQFEPMYRWIIFQQRQTLQVKAIWETAPLAEGARMDILDEFTTDTLTAGDWTFDAGSLGIMTPSPGNGTILPNGSLTTERALIQTERGYSVLDAQATVFGTSDTTITNYKIGVRLRRSAPTTFVEVYVDDTGAVSRLRIDVVIGGTRTNRASVNLAVRLSGPASAHVRGRIEGNVVYAEHFTGTPTPLGTPTNSTSYTLSGGEQTSLVAGQGGFSWIPQGANALIGMFEYLPFTYRNQATPSRIALGGAIPGSAPARAAIEISTSGPASAPAWGLAAWTTRPRTPVASTVAPFGVIEAETGVNLAIWSSAADGTYRGGNGLKATASGAQTALAEWWVDPATLAPDDFTMHEINLEIWARVSLSQSLVVPSLKVYAVESFAGAEGNRYTHEWGSGGLLLTKPSSGTVFRMTRAGTITFPIDIVNPTLWALKLELSYGVGSSGAVGLDYLMLVPVRQRIGSPTAIPFDSAYPQFIPSTQARTKRINTDLSTKLSGTPSGNTKGGPHSSMQGSQILLPPGNVDLVTELSNLVPDDPTSNTANEMLTFAETVHVSVIPRYFLGRDD